MNHQEVIAQPSTNKVKNKNIIEEISNDKTVSKTYDLKLPYKKETQNASEIHNNKTMKILIYASYCLMTTCEGALEPLGGSLYNKFESQLDTSSSNIAYILSVKPILSAFGAIITAGMLDYLKNSHRYISVISLVTAVTLSFLVYIESLYLMFFAFGVFGYYIGAVFVSYPVYIFRLYPNNQNRALFFCMCIYGVSKTIMPLLIDLSLYLFSSYGQSLNIISFLLLIVVALMLCLPTPKHDPLRSVRASVGTDHDESDYNKMNIKLINESLKNNSRIKCYSNLLMVLLMVMMFTFSSFQSGTVNFIQTFLTKHLHHKESIARYLISSYYFGQLFYRIIVTVLFKEVNPIISMCCTNIVLIVVGLIFVGFGNVSFIKDSYIWLLYVIYITIGFSASAVFPGVYKWAELIKTVGGVLSGLFVVAFAFGDAGMVTFVGTLVHQFGVYIIPFPICGYIFASFCFTFIGTIVYYRYSIIKDRIIHSCVN